MRLIDADTLRKDVEKDRDASDMPKMWYQGIEYAINHIIHAPTVDAIEVVRCKDCKFYLNSNEKCGLVDTRLRFYETDKVWTEDSFCSWGERREDETD